MRDRGAAGGAEEAHFRQPHWCPWSKPVNVETWGHVSGTTVIETQSMFPHTTRFSVPRTERRRRGSSGTAAASAEQPQFPT